MARKYLALQSERTIERRITERAAGLPILRRDIARVVDAVIATATESHSTERTERPVYVPTVTSGRKRYVVGGTVSGAERRSMLHRCSCADRTACSCVQSYPVLDGAPVGSVPTLATDRAERAAASAEREWAARCALADAGMTRADRRNAKRAAARARSVRP